MDGFSIPPYEVSQDADHVYIDVSATGAAATKPNIAVEGCIFGFHLEPYYLPLVLPGAVTRPASDAETIATAVRDSASSSSSSQGGVSHFRVTLNKVQRGEQFAGLEQLQPQLLPEDQLKQALSDAEQSKGFFQPPPGTVNEGSDEAAKALLQQALRNQGLTTVTDDDGEAAIDAGTAQAPAASSARGQSFAFGFRGKFTGSLIPGGCADTRNVLEVSNPDAVEPGQREQAALAYEEQRWDEGIYMDNFLDIDGELAHLLRFQPRLPSPNSCSSAAATGTDVDVETLALVLQLLFAFSYDERTNEGDPTVESGWTIAKLCRSLSASTLPQTCTEAATSLESVVASVLIGCVRRALTIPLYRHWELAMACIHDTLGRIKAGREHVNNCVHMIATRLEEGEDAILCRLSEVWIAGLLAQPPNQEQLEKLGRAIQSVMQQANVISKQAVGGEEWDLDVLEEAAKQALEDGEGGFV
ncbi:uncharacterized protein UTRI_05125_B [Ustilago trichophora]|uniref:Uncharacterized protein n=1 Tax=Ustilago trichophora TaxID=86804 RepID=A0A5C3EE75_9BASI|nr:uncharacterized protein UTRI_05125_B [Ustilago trichophora]